MSKYPVINSVAVILYDANEDKILLIKRKGEPFNGYWALAGGKLEKGEEVIEGMVREVQEETGLYAVTGYEIGTYTEYGDYHGQTFEYHAHCYVVDVYYGVVKGQEDEVSDIRWFKIADIPETLAFKHREMIDDFLLRKRVTF